MYQISGPCLCGQYN